MGNGGYDVQAYDLDLVWDNATNVLSGSAMVEAIATIDLSTFNLDFYGLEVGVVKVDGVLSSFSHEGQELTVTPGDALRAGQLFTVTIEYGGMPKVRYDRVGGVASGWMAEESTVAVPPFSSAGWFPANDHPRDKAFFTLRLTVPKPLDVVASGRLVEATESDDTTTFVWRTEHVVFMPTVAIDDLTRCHSRDRTA